MKWKDVAIGLEEMVEEFDPQTLAEFHEEVGDWQWRLPKRAEGF